MAILLTCHNRKEKTLKSLTSLREALSAYNDKYENQPLEIKPTVYLTDDGCTDGTADAVLKCFPDEDINILKGDGNLFWAGGMRLAWKEALKRHEDWDYYLLLNDDTLLYPTVFDELSATHIYCLNTYHQAGIYSGITCDPDNRETITYGGDVIVNKFTGSRMRLGKSDRPQMADMTNANIFLVPHDVVNRIGILYEGYIHSAADFDYTYLARKAGCPVLITADACGICARDHKTDEDKKEMFLSMKLRERREYLKNPVHSDADYVTLIRRTMPMKYPVTLFFRWLNLYMPRIFYWFK